MDGMQTRGDARGVDVSLAQHCGRKPGPCWLDIGVAVLQHLSGFALRASALDLQRAGDQDVVAIRISDVQAGLDGESSDVDEVGVRLPRGDQDDWLRLRRLCLGAARPCAGARGAVPTQACAADGLCHGLEELELLLIGALGRACRGAALQVQLLLDLVAARIRDLVTELPQLPQIAPKLPLGDARTIRELKRVEAGLGNDRSEDVEKPGEPLGAIHAARLMGGWLADLFPGSGVALKRIGLSL